MKKLTTNIRFRNLFLTSLLLFSIILKLHAQVEEGYYTIQLAVGGTAEGAPNGFVDLSTGVLHRDGDVMTLKREAPLFSQVWKIEQDGTEFYIKQSGTGKSMDASYRRRHENGCPVITWNFNGGETQRWKLVSQGGNRYHILLALNDKKLSFDYGSGANLYLTNVNDNNRQVFILKKSTRIIRAANYVDLRANQTPYAHQAGRGTCTYFASIAAMEAAYKKAGYGDRNFSEQFYSIFGKTFGLHYTWSDNINANYRENQYATTQGGGSLEYLKYLKIPAESVSPYENEEDLNGYDWANMNQRTCNDFNLNLIRIKLPPLHTVPDYFSVHSCEKITSITESDLERVLRGGLEIKIGIYGGSHALLLVGFDKTDPANKKFIIKNSYQPTGTPCTEKLEYLPYSEISGMVDAEYITAVKAPEKWEELAVIGRWKLDYDGWKGQLDIYHIPGIQQFVLDRYASGIADRRLGTFYDERGNAFRVNGSIQKINSESMKLIFYIDGTKPNLRWDELRGRRFEYIISNPDANFMAGVHTDALRKQFGGYALKAPASYFSSDAFSVTGNVSSYENKRFLLRLGAEEYFGTFNYYNPAFNYVTGVFRNSSGASKTIKLQNLNRINSFILYVVEDLSSGIIITHSWEQGISSGSIINASAKHFPACLIRREATLTAPASVPTIHEFNISLFPNPALGQVTVMLKEVNDKKTTGLLNDIREMKIIDKSGIVRTSAKYAPGKKSVQFNVSGLPSDVYVVEISDGINKGNVSLIVTK